MKDRKYVNKISSCFLVLLLFVFGTMTVSAAEQSARTGMAEGFYRHPQTGIIEDAGGDAQEALGQSMVTNVVDSQALLESDATGEYFLSVRLHLMNSISEVVFTEQEPGESDWKNVSYERTAEGDDQADFRIPVESENTIVRSECFVEPMGRSVTFFITVQDFVDGNAGGFVLMEDSDTDSDTEPDAGTSGENADEAEGLIIGGNGTSETNSGDEADSQESQITGSAQLTVNKGEKIEMQQLNLSGGVWCVLFIIVFCATILGNLLVMAVKIVIKNKVKKRSGQEYHDLQELSDKEDDFLNLEDTKLDWEAPDDGEK